MDISVDIKLIKDFFIKHPIFSVIIFIIVVMIWFCSWSLYRQLSNHLPTQITEIKDDMKELKEDMKDGFTEVNRDIREVNRDMKDGFTEVNRDIKRLLEKSNQE